MAEMLVRVVDKVNPDDPVKHAQLTKRGDVIVICDDGHGWSGAESAGDPWVVVKVPGVTVEQLSAFIVPDPEDAKVPHKIPQRRAFRFDLDKHAGAQLTHADAMALRQRTPSMLHPDFL